MSQQYLRAWNVTVGTFQAGSQSAFAPGTKPVVLTQNATGFDLHATFEVRAPDIETPNTCRVRIYNLSAATAARIYKGEFTGVVVQAGYVSGSAQIFSGTIAQVRQGKINAKDSYVDIFASDGNAAYKFAVLNQTIAAGKGANPQAVAQAIAAQMAKQNVAAGDFTGLSGGINPRGKVLYGMGRSFARDLAATTGTHWSIQDGVLQFVPLTGYLPGEAVVLNAVTGLLDVPESTPNGINVKCLLNPKIVVGGLIQIANSLISQSALKQFYGFPDYTSITREAVTTNDGFYKVLVHEIEGDTRGDAWFSELTCLAVDVSAEISKQIDPYGG